MTTSVNGLGRARPTSLADNNRHSTVKKDDANAATAGSPDLVSYTETLSKLKRLSSELASEPPVDKARVDSLKTAISNGEYPVDGKKVAEQFLRLERELGNI